MKKIENTSFLYLIIEIFTLIIAGIIIWPLFDIFWCNVITHSEFHYSVFEHIVGPIIFGIIAGIIFWLFNVMSKKNKK